MRAFLAGHGITPELRFGDLRGIPVRLVSTDLNSGRPVIHGADSDDRVVEAVLASGALPPWIHPLEEEGRLLLDGGMVSNLPIEPAMSEGATEIIALDISEPRRAAGDDSGFGPWLSKLNNTVHQRQLDLELALAAARRVPVQRIWLRFEHPVAVWDFSHTEELMAAGYALAKAVTADWKSVKRPSWRRSLAG